jgi:hypothetical protein
MHATEMNVLYQVERRNDIKRNKIESNIVLDLNGTNSPTVFPVMKAHGVGFKSPRLARWTAFRTAMRGAEIYYKLYIRTKWFQNCKMTFCGNMRI